MRYVATWLLSGGEYDGDKLIFPQPPLSEIVALCPLSIGPRQWRCLDDAFVLVAMHTLKPCDAFWTKLTVVSLIKASHPKNGVV